MFWEWLTANAEKVAGGVLGIGAVFALMWSKIQSMRRESAKTDATVEVAISSKEVYEQMKDRLADLAAQVTALSAKVDAQQEQLRMREMEIHKMRIRILDLEHSLETHGIPLPPIRS